MRILFVCLGNICRSPAAEMVFKAAAPHIECDSAGTAGWHVGKPPYGPMQDAARLRGIDLSKPRARQLLTDDFDRFDMIIAMDANNLRDIEEMRPRSSKVPAHILTDFASATDCDHVPDPYFTRDFEGALDLIEDACRGLAKVLDR